MPMIYFTYRGWKRETHSKQNKTLESDWMKPQSIMFNAVQSDILPPVVPGSNSARLALGVILDALFD